MSGGQRDGLWMGWRTLRGQYFKAKHWSGFSLILGLARQVTLESAASMHKARRGAVLSRAGVEGVFQLRHRCWNLMLSRPMATLSQNVRSVKL